jgi:hypothetical protein
VLARGEEGRVRAAETHRHAEALRRTEGDVGAHFAGRLQQHQRHQVGRDGDHAALVLHFGNRRGEIGDLAACVRILEQGAEEFVLVGVSAAGRRPARSRSTRRASSARRWSAGRQASSTKNTLPLALEARRAMVMASAAAVASSSSEALAISSR